MYQLAEVKTDNLTIVVEVIFYEGEIDTLEPVGYTCHTLADLQEELANGEYTLADLYAEEWQDLSDEDKRSLVIKALVNDDIDPTED